MDLETENRIAAILMKEAAELHHRAAEEGMLAYLSKPSVRSRPNSRFLTATVLRVQQSNKAAEVSEMWRIRQKERDLDNRLKRSVHDDDRRWQHGYKTKVRGVRITTQGTKQEMKVSEMKRWKNFHTQRVKGGKGATGSRMDEMGPYLLSSLEDKENRQLSLEVRWQRVVYGPEKRTHSGTSNRDAHTDEKDGTSPRKKHKAERKSKSKKLKGKKRRTD